MNVVIFKWSTCAELSDYVSYVFICLSGTWFLHFERHTCWLLQLRGAIDPKRHYKKGDSKSKTLPKYFQVNSGLHCKEIITWKACEFIFNFFCHNIQQLNPTFVFVWTKSGGNSCRIFTRLLLRQIDKEGEESNAGWWATFWSRRYSLQVW